MNESELDAVLRTAVRHDPSRATGVLQAVGPDLLEEIMHTPDTYRTAPDDDRPDSTTPGGPAIELPPSPPSPRRGRRRSLAVVLVAAAVAAAVAVPAYAFRDHRHEGTPAAPRPAVTPSATSSGPSGLVLVDQPGWEVDHNVSQDGPRSWDVTWARGGVTLEITSSPAPAGSATEPAGKPGPGATWSPKAVAVLGTEGMLDREDANDWAVDLTARGETLRARAYSLTQESFTALLAKLQWADEAVFAATMPAGVVTPGRELPVAREMLSDIPLPPGLQPDYFALGFTNDRYQFAAHVTGKVTCDWIAIELKARKSGDTATRKKADVALKSSHQWAVLKEIEPQGGWSEALWEEADAAAKGGMLVEGKRISVADSYKSSLGCDDQ